MPSSGKHLFLRPGTSSLIKKIYNLLYKAYGPQGWWPASSPFEVAVGTILTQNTSWSNVEKAITNLKDKRLLRPDRIHRASLRSLAAAIRPSGYYNIKALRLKNLARFILADFKGKIGNMGSVPQEILRTRLLEINGIGPETCDSILLYALNKPVFVIDAYTRRITECLYPAAKGHDYNYVQSIFTRSLPADAGLFNEYHALIVCHAKNVCRNKPQCERCILRKLKRVADASLY
jgi:endonuclease III related protein